MPPGPRIRLPYGISGYALHVVHPARLPRLATVRIGIVAEAPQPLPWLLVGDRDGPC
jgi:hypothetical protein